MSINKIHMEEGSLGQYYYKQSWVSLFRPLTLSGTISPALAGTAIAGWQHEIHFSLFLGVLFGALLIQAATNLLNDYFDFKNGQDKEKWTTEPMSGQHLPAHHTLPIIAGVMMTVAAFIGIWLGSVTSVWLIAVGAAGVAAGYAYSAGKRSLAARGLGELTAAVFLGPVITLIAFTVQGGRISAVILGVSLVFASLIASMILTNNIRDLEKDRLFRNTLANRLGKSGAVKLLAVLLAVPYLVVIVLVMLQRLPVVSLLVLGAIPVAVMLYRSYAPDASKKQQQLGMKWAARHHWVFGLLLTATLLIPYS
ncbi:1,4-dihydroxy-2-naphthoate octaprenyltransferase [Lentibacillus sp. JNUCC-1]|uniref:prenyltransferase n=1 Tax=Lentibacillus sp. JNUCC-1 TaxID=2654513 RepID=UPI0012E759E7|nr:prenyltransferase [Lentibacillus sp. JNUCC-1]MUV37663.1 1,4-dihydroxy-2-naphthoate octaprenyltransferase [Lentibacillus sp. JNUCC-1]